MLTVYENKVVTNYEDKSKKKWVIIASGPSLTKEDVELTRGQNVIAINDNYRLAPWANILYACDPQWWKWHEDKKDLLEFKGEKWTQTQSWTEDDKKHFIAKHHLNFIESKNDIGISQDPKIIYTGSNSGYQAINLAYHFGAKQIILLGYDMQATGGKRHWFGDHPNKVVSGWHKWIPFYQQMAADAERLGLEIINCTRKTALHCFRRDQLENVL